VFAPGGVVRNSLRLAFVALENPIDGMQAINWLDGKFASRLASVFSNSTEGI